MKTIFSPLFLIFSIFVLSSCDIELQRSLLLSGKNRSELEKVLKYYKEDRIKSEAAKYLIRNAQYHSFGDTLDVCVLSAEYLKANIDSAFYLWENSNYIKHLTYEEFCESILPYKTFAGQQPDGWRNQLHIIKGDKSMKIIKQIDAIQKDPYPILWKIEEKLPQTYKNLHVNGCRKTAALTTLYARANGLAVVEDFVPAWPNANGYHVWNRCYSIYNKTNTTVTPHRYAKVYRKTFTPNRILLKIKQDFGFVPQSFHDEFCKDVTTEYTRTASVGIPLHSKNKYAFLSVFNSDNWIMVDAACIKKGKAVFNNVGIDVLYIVGDIDKNGNFFPKSKPFILDLNGQIKYIDSNSNNRKDITLYRKYRASSTLYDIAKNIKKTAYIIGSNDSSFSSADTLAVIPKESIFSGNLKITSEKPYRYYRLCSNTKSKLGFSELCFMDSTGINFPIYGNPRLIDMDQLSNENIWDGHPADFDFVKPKRLTSILYFRRGDGNCIFPGDIYELYQWSEESGWSFVEEKIAEDCSIKFKNIPTGVLLHIKNISNGSQNGLFIWDAANERPIWM